MKKDLFPNFEYEAKDITRFAQSTNLFTLLLKDGRVTHYEADVNHVNEINDWLTSNNIPNAKSSPLTKSPVNKL